MPQCHPYWSILIQCLLPRVLQIDQQSMSGSYYHFYQSMRRWIWKAGRQYNPILDSQQLQCLCRRTHLLALLIGLVLQTLRSTPLLGGIKETKSADYRYTDKAGLNMQNHDSVKKNELIAFPLVAHIVSFKFCYWLSKKRKKENFCLFRLTSFLHLFSSQ